MTLEARPEVVTPRERTGAVGTVEAPRRGGWIDVWDPEDAGFWAAKGRRVAQRNLWPSIFAEFLGFSVWQLWSIVVVSLPAAGFGYSTDQMFWLCSSARNASAPRMNGSPRMMSVNREISVSVQPP